MTQKHYSATPLSTLSIVMLMVFYGCVESFAPDVVDTVHSYLVVDGLINNNGITVINLSRSQKISDNNKPQAEAKASVVIQEEQGPHYPLTEGRMGTYTSSYLTLNPQKKYRLYIKTAFNKEYVSDYVPVRYTPDFEVVWKVENEGLQIAINSQGRENNTRYYRWQHEETWEFNSFIYSAWEYRNGQILPRTNNIFQCWRTERNPVIKIASTDNLSENVLSEHPLVLLPKNSEKLQVKYSILVKQQSLTKEAYQYWETLSKNTENIGTLFDPFPSQLTGNITCLNDPKEPVFGFVSVTNEIEKRIFISTYADLPTSWHGINRKSITYASCETGLMGKDGLTPANPAYLIVDRVMLEDGSMDYTYSSVGCVDCRLRGTNVMPDFWH
ncbi:DUF4249 domain-containing protein [Adhaeribacter aquaticus]|uniref:DUF4249 domain-containing protein n=1 Tax=Adhaeribacter aquaticus TaxID=299567 RepID=UPI0003F94582|nr:DUF4249 domain-containing protein [Adhaeribacter aquaticus]